MEKYKNIRSGICDGDIIATKWNGIFSRIIKFFTRSNYSHVWILYNIHGRVFVIEAQYGKWIRMILASKVAKTVDFDIFRWGEAQQDTLSEAMSRLGDRYDLIWAVASPFIDTKTHQAFCSEFVSEILWMEFEGIKKRGATPADVINKCRKITQD